MYRKVLKYDTGTYGTIREGLRKVIMESKSMVRVIALTAMAGGFLAISPHLRDNVVDGYVGAGHLLEVHSPYSYVGLGLAAAAGLIVFLYKASQPR